MEVEVHSSLNKDSDIEQKQPKNDKAKIRSAITKTITWGLGIIVAVGISLVGSLSVFGILTLPAIFTSATLMEILPWFLVGLGTTIGLTCRKGFAKNFLHVLINHSGGFRECDRSKGYNKPLYLVWIFICVMSILSSGFLSLLSNLVFLWVYHRCRLKAPNFAYLLAGSLGLFPTLAIVVFAFHFSALAFIAIAPMLVFTFLAMGVHFIRERYFEPEDQYEDILGASSLNLEEDADGSRNNWIWKLFPCVATSGRNPENEEENDEIQNYLS